MINKAIFRPPNRTVSQTEYIPNLINIAINKTIKINANIMIFTLLKINPDATSDSNLCEYCENQRRIVALANETMQPTIINPICSQ